MSTSYAMEIESLRTGETSNGARPFEEIPGEAGLPIIGSLFQYIRDPLALMMSAYERFGPVCRMRVAGYDFIWMLGPEANRLVLLDRDLLFSSFGGYDPLIGELFPRGLMLRDFEDHHAHRAVMLQAFKRDALARYLDLMTPVIHEGVGSWMEGRRSGKRKKIVFLPKMKSLALDVATIVFMGDVQGSNATKVNRAFNDAVAAGGAVIRYPIPGLTYWRGLRGRRYLERYFQDRVAWKRQNPDDSLLSRLCSAESEDGKRYSDDEIVDHMIFLMMAAHDTTTLTLTHIVYRLAKNPVWQERLLAEAQALGPNPSYADLRDAPNTDRVFKEALRMQTPVPGLPRRTTREAVINGYRIPEGTLCLVQMHFTHHMSSIWTDPFTFDPDRFAPGREEHKAHKYAWVPFGGGAHKCIGVVFGELEAKTALLEMIRRYRFEVPHEYVLEYNNYSLPVPRDGLPVTLVAR